MATDHKIPENHLTEITEQLTSESVSNLKRMIELGKRPDGQRLSREDIQSCMEVVMLWEATHLPETQRSGYIAQKCNTKGAPEKTDNSDILQFVAK